MTEQEEEWMKGPIGRTYAGHITEGRLWWQTPTGYLMVNGPDDETCLKQLTGMAKHIRKKIKAEHGGE